MQAGEIRSPRSLQTHILPLKCCAQNHDMSKKNDMMSFLHPVCCLVIRIAITLYAALSMLAEVMVVELTGLAALNVDVPYE